MPFGDLDLRNSGFGVLSVTAVGEAGPAINSELFSFVIPFQPIASALPTRLRRKQPSGNLNLSFGSI